MTAGMAFEGVTRYPLYWPEGWKRANHRRRSAYHRNNSFAGCRDFVLAEMRRLGSREVIISSNIPLRNDGLPKADFAEPKDPGVAIYWVQKGAPRVIACDAWTKVWENLRAIGLTIAAMRALDRHGASQVLERAFAGFAALPAAGSARGWREVLFGDPHIAATLDQVERAFIELAKIHHPDKGGDTARMAEISAARSAARKELGGE